MTMFASWSKEIRICSVAAFCAFILAILGPSIEANGILDFDAIKSADILKKLYNRKKIITKIENCYEKQGNQLVFENMTSAMFGLIRGSDIIHQFISNEEWDTNERLFKNSFPAVQCLLETIVQAAGPSCKISEKLLTPNLLKELQPLDSIPNIDPSLAILAAEVLCRIKMYREKYSQHLHWEPEYLDRKEISLYLDVPPLSTGNQDLSSLTRGLTRQKRQVAAIGSLIFNNLDILALFFASAALLAVGLVFPGLVQGPPGIPGPAGATGPIGPAGIPAPTTTAAVATSSTTTAAPTTSSTTTGAPTTSSTTTGAPTTSSTTTGAPTTSSTTTAAPTTSSTTTGAPTTSSTTTAAPTTSSTTTTTNQIGLRFLSGSHSLLGYGSRKTDFPKLLKHIKPVTNAPK